MRGEGGNTPRVEEVVTVIVDGELRLRLLVQLQQRGRQRPHVTIDAPAAVRAAHNATAREHGLHIQPRPGETRRIRSAHAGGATLR